MEFQKKIFSGSLRNIYDKARLMVFDAPAVAPELAPAPATLLEILPMMPPTLPLPRPLMSPEQQIELDLLLQPIKGDEPCGPAMRYDPVFIEIRVAREEDDPSLPMRQWERPLKLADWGLIESRCKLMLTSRSKDLQIAAWLLESWTRQHAFEGLYRGLTLIDRLLREYWTPLHPVIEDADDCDARIAPMEWLNESISATLRVHVPLLNMVGYKPPKLTLADWERLTSIELSAQGQPKDSTKPKPGEQIEIGLTREDVIAYARQYLLQDLDVKIKLVQGCTGVLSSLLAFVDDQLGMQAPNLLKLKGTLDVIERVLTQLAPEQKGPEMPVDIPLSITQSIQVPRAGTDEAITPAAVMLHGWTNRHEAYATLSALADYLSHVEPHSPTPYLLRRAVNWGRMPLPELMAEIIREEGDLNRLMNVLGLKE